MKIKFAENYSKSEIIKGAVLTSIFVSFCFIPGSLFEKLTDSDFIINNKLFIGYSLLIIAAIILYFRPLKEAIIDFLKDKFKEKNITFSAIIFVCVIAIVVISGIILSKLSITDTNEKALEGVAKQGISILYIIAAVIFGPIVEELVYRFFIFRLIYKHNFIIAHVTSALLFSFMHFASVFFKNFDFIILLNMIPYFFMGLGFSIAYDKTKCLTYPILIHMAINALATFG